MSLKEFFKPTILKVLLTVIFLVITIFFVPFFNITPQLCTASIPPHCYNKSAINYLYIIFLIVYYWVSCSVVHLFKKEKFL